MIQIAPQMRILVATEAVDGRKGIDSLAWLCQEKLWEDPFSGCLFVFRSRRGTSIRILTYDGQGFWLAQKRLSKGRFVWWPSGTEPDPKAASPSSAVAAGGGQPGGGSGAGVAACERVKKSRWYLGSKWDLGILRRMPTEWRYRGRAVSAEDIEFVRQLIAAHPGASRRALSAKLCEVWGWKQANGALRDMICRGLLLMLDRAGHIDLPPVRFTPHNPLVERQRPAPALIDTTPIRGSLSELRPVDFQPVRRTSDEPLFNSLIEQHHYLGYEQPVGEHLKYIVWAAGRPMACLAWSSAPRHLGSRDRFIGWLAEARRRNIRFLAYNTRFLILPWVQVERLASHILGRMAKRLSEDWERLYGHPIYFLETFVDPERFRSTCYRAANWVVLGRTTGRGKDDQTNRPNRPIKEVLGYPLTPRFRRLPAEVE